jgi:DNA-binding response OmpR family regulator
MAETSILTVEDDEEIADLIHRYLSREGYRVERARDGREALERWAEGGWALLILDLMLPRVGGLDVLRRVRRDGDVPVIILSARGEERDKLTGLGLGADDYMTKPFSMPELAARVKARLRRGLRADGPGGSSVLRAGGLELDPERFTARRDGRQVDLTSTEFEILRLLMADPGRVHSKSGILDAVRGSSCAVEESGIMVHVSNLRRKLEDDPAHPRYIRTVWGIGYRFEGEAGE